MSAIRMLKIADGQDVLAKAQLVDGVWTLENPMVVIMQPDGQIGLAPYTFFFTSKECRIKDSHVITTGEPVDQLRNEFVQHFGGGVVIPPPGKLVL